MLSEHYGQPGLTTWSGLRAEMYAAVFSNDVIVAKNCFVQRCLSLTRNLFTECSKKFVITFHLCLTVHEICIVYPFFETSGTLLGHILPPLPPPPPDSKSCVKKYAHILSNFVSTFVPCPTSAALCFVGHLSTFSSTLSSPCGCCSCVFSDTWVAVSNSVAIFRSGGWLQQWRPERRNEAGHGTQLHAFRSSWN